MDQIRGHTTNKFEGVIHVDACTSFLFSQKCILTTRSFFWLIVLLHRQLNYTFLQNTELGLPWFFYNSLGISCPLIFEWIWNALFFWLVVFLF